MNVIINQITSRRIQMDISEGLKKFCYDSIHELAEAYDLTLSHGREYERGFNMVMDMLSVPQKAKEDMFLQAQSFSKVGGIPYHKLSPVNQFMVSISPYVLYCIENKLKAGSSLKQEATTLQFEDEEGFYHYLDKTGMSIAQKIKGALWKPRLFGLGNLLDAVSKLRYRKSRNEGAQRATIIEGLDLILKNLFMQIVVIYTSEYPHDAQETNLMRAGTVLNELVIEELRGEQIAFKEKNTDFIKSEKIRLLKLERIRKGILSFLTAKGASYKYVNNPKAIIWVTGAKELAPNITIPDSLDKIIELIKTYLNNLPDNDK
jgi:hypothetical protein